MIGIQLESGAFLYLPPNTSIRTEMFSSIFYEQQGDYSYPFNIPVKENAWLLGYPEAIMNKTVQKKYNVKIYRYGNFWKDGILRIRNIKGNSYVSNLNINGGYFADLIKDVTLPDLDLGGTRSIVPYPYLAMKLSGGSTTGNVRLFVFNPDYGPDAMDKFVPFNTSINQTIIDLAAAFNADTAGMAAAHLDRAEASGSIIKIYSVDSNKPRYEGLATSGNGGNTFLPTDDFNTGDMVTHMGLAAASTYPTYDYTFFPVKNPTFYDGSDNDDLKSDFCRYLNYYVSGKFHGNGESALSPSVYAFSACPFAYMLYVFSQCFVNFGYTAEGSFLDDSEIKKLVIYNNYALDNEVKAYDTGASLGNSWAKTMDLKNHVPDMSVGAFINAIKQTFFIALFYDLENKSVVIKTLNDILDDPDYDDWTDKVDPTTDDEDGNDSDGYIISPDQDSDDDKIDERVKNTSAFTIQDAVDDIADLPAIGNAAGDLRLVNNLNSYYKADQIYDSSTGTYTWTWSFYSENIGSYTVGNGKDKISLGLATTAMERITGASGGDYNWWIPSVEQEGSGTGFSMGKNDFSLRLLFYRGLQTGYLVDNSPMTYPMATSLDKDYDYSSIGNYTLAIDGENGIYQKWGKKWLDFKQNTRIIEKNVRLTQTDIQNLDFSRKKRINNVNYLLAKIDFTDTMQGMKIAACLFYKV